MKKYLLNKYNKILVRMKLTEKLYPNNEKFHLWYNVPAPKHCQDIEYGEEFYAFEAWRKSKRKWSNVFSEKDNLLEGSIVKETNSPIRYLWWRIKYRDYNSETRRHKKGYRK